MPKFKSKAHSPYLSPPPPPPPPPLNILLTNGRFPVSIDLARQLHLAGHTVSVVDPMHYHVCRFSRAVHKSYHVPAPHVDGPGYIAAVASAVRDGSIDLIIPMHEEIFYLASCSNETIISRLLAPPLETLITLHNKWEFSRFLLSIGLDAPEAWLCRTRADLAALPRTRELALKPVYGRACSNVYHLRPGDPLPDADIDEDTHYIAQEWLTGRRFCSYAVVRDGRVKAFAVYPVQDTIDGSSAVFFTSVEHRGIREYVDRIAAAMGQGAGQVACDFIETDGGRLVAIECNPRATSGIHLFSRTRDLADALVDGGGGGKVWEARPGAKRQLMPGMLMWERDGQNGGYRGHMRRLMGSRDVLFSRKDLLPSLMQPFLLTSYYKICSNRHMKLPEMFQWDLTWEPRGEELARVRERVEGRRKSGERGGERCREEGRRGG